MDEENIVVSTSELEVESNVELFQPEDTVTETFEEISMDLPSEIEVNVAEISGVVTQEGEGSNHIHEIEQVNGLEDALTELSSTHEFYSQYGGYAEFRQWTSDSKSYYVKHIKDTLGGEIGYFVSLVGNNGNSYIDICNETSHSIYGVTVRQSAFCGYQDERYDVLNDNSVDRTDGNQPYAKVCLLGNVSIRVHSEKNYNNIHFGDYVVSDEHGCAIKSENNVGFKVVLKRIENGTYTVVIALVPQNDNAARVMEEIAKNRVSLENISLQVGTLEDSIGNLNSSNIHLSDQFEGLEDLLKETTAEIDKQLENSKEALDTAQQLAQDAKDVVTSMNETYVTVLGQVDGAHTKVDQALADIGDIQKNMTVLDEHGDKIAGFFADANPDGANLATLVKNQTDITSMQQQVDDTGGSIKFLVAHADMYSVGKYSPTYSLSYEAAKNILDKGKFIYVPTEAHTEESYIYQCVLEINIDSETKAYCKISDNFYSFTSDDALGVGNKLIYNKRLGEFTINGNKADLVLETEIGAEITPLEFKSEWSTDFEQGVYQWYNIGPTNDDYGWQKLNDAKISYKTEEPSNESGELELWYCADGLIGDGNKYDYEFTPGTLYRWNGTKWIAAATVNDSGSRITSLFNQTAEYMESTITDVKGNMTTIRQGVDEISSTVSKVDGALSTVIQNAGSIVAGTYNGEDDAAQLAVVLNRISSTVSTTSNTLVGDFTGSPPNADKITDKYAQPPTWNEGQFVFSGEPDPNGTYCLNPDNPEQYYKLDNGKYKVYIMGAQAIASLQSQVEENKAKIDSFTGFDTTTNSTLTSLFQESDLDSATIGSVVMGQYRKRTEIKLELTDDELVQIKTRYDDPPSWEKNDIGKYECSYADDATPSENGVYCIPEDGDNTYYYKLVFDADSKVVGYEKYELERSNYATIMQKVDENGASIGFAVGTKDTNGGIFVDAVNDQTSALIQANKIGINGLAAFRDNMRDGTTTISGNYIRTGTLTSEKYNGPITHVLYGVKLDTSKMKIVTSSKLSDCIYYAPYVVGKYSISDLDLYWADTIGVDSDIFSMDDASNKTYYVSNQDFDLIPSEIQLDGMKIDLNDGTIYSKGLQLDRGGNLTITGRISATSGYIGDGDHGFTINPNVTQYTGTKKLEPDSMYYTKIEDRYYRFNTGSKSTFTSGSYSIRLTIIKGDGNSSYFVINSKQYATDTLDSCPRGEMIHMEPNGTYYYSLRYNQDSLSGKKDGSAGVYISPEGLGLGNGNFVVDNQGNLTTHGDITMYSQDSTGVAKQVLKISEGKIELTGSITWPSTGTGTISVKVQYSATGSSSGTWSSTYVEGTHNYMRYSFDGGTNWGDIIRITGAKGDKGDTGSSGGGGGGGGGGSTSTVTQSTIFNLLTKDGKDKGIFPFYEGDGTDNTTKGYLYINADFIRGEIMSTDTLISEAKVLGKLANVIRIKEGLFELFSDSKYQQAKLRIGYSKDPTTNYVPFISFGHGSGGGTFTIEDLKEEFNINTGLIYKSNDRMSLRFLSSHPSRDITSIHFINSSQSGNTYSKPYIHIDTPTLHVTANQITLTNKGANDSCIDLASKVRIFDGSFVFGKDLATFNKPITFLGKIDLQTACEVWGDGASLTVHSKNGLTIASGSNLYVNGPSQFGNIVTFNQHVTFKGGVSGIGGSTATFG